MRILWRYSRFFRKMSFEKEFQIIHKSHNTWCLHLGTSLKSFDKVNIQSNYIHGCLFLGSYSNMATQHRRHTMAQSGNYTAVTWEWCDCWLRFAIAVACGQLKCATETTLDGQWRELEWVWERERERLVSECTELKRQKSHSLPEDCRIVFEEGNRERTNFNYNKIEILFHFKINYNTLVSCHNIRKQISAESFSEKAKQQHLQRRKKAKRRIEALKKHHPEGKRNAIRTSRIKAKWIFVIEQTNQHLRSLEILIDHRI